MLYLCHYRELINQMGRSKTYHDTDATEDRVCCRWRISEAHARAGIHTANGATARAERRSRRIPPVQQAQPRPPATLPEFRRPLAATATTAWSRGHRVAPAPCGAYRCHTLLLAGLCIPLHNASVPEAEVVPLHAVRCRSISQVARTEHYKLAAICNHGNTGAREGGVCCTFTRRSDGDADFLDSDADLDLNIFFIKSIKF